MSRLDDNEIRFRGICLNGRYKGKEIEGTVNIETVRARREEGSGWSPIVVLLLLLLGINLIAVKYASVRDTPSTPVSSPQFSPQPVVEEQISPELSN